MGNEEEWKSDDNVGMRQARGQRPIWAWDQRCWERQVLLKFMGIWVISIIEYLLMFGGKFYFL